MASPLITGSSIYGSDAPGITGSKAETPQITASGGEMDKHDAPSNPLKSIFIMVGVLIGIRFLWGVAGEVT